jgi:transposase-like protein
MIDDDMTGEVAVLKCDGRGRVRSTLAQRLEAVAEFERSGLSGPAFCRVAGINYQTFVGWRNEARRKAGAQGGELLEVAARPGGIRLLEASLQGAQSLPGGAGIEVHLLGGARVFVGDAAQTLLAAHLIKALA